MKKQAKNCALAAITVMSAASMAHAVEINIYGASAEFNYWNANAHNFVASKCTSASAAATKSQKIVEAGTGITQSVNHGYVLGTTCGSTYGANLTFRYSGIASAEGFLSVTKQAPLFVPDTATNGIVGSCSVANGERIMLADGTNLGCEAVNVGTTDLSIENINQTADVITLPTFKVPTGYATQTTIVTPFAFFVNNNVTASQCFTASGDNMGITCATSTDCNPTTGNFNNVTTNVCTSAVIDNLSRLQAVQLFQGNVAHWSDLGSNFNTNPVTVCLRVPGSGTHATLDKTVMSAGDLGWGAPGATEFPSSNTDTTAPPVVTYVESTGDMKTCLNNTGAVGYMDGDNGTAGSYSKVKYQGVGASRENLRKGGYDFYAVGHIYYDNTKTAPLSTTIINDIVATTKSTTSMDALTGGRNLFYAAQSEMKFLRGSDDAYPTAQ